MIRLFIVWLVFFPFCYPLPAYGADGTYCQLYAREMVRAYIRSVPPADVAAITADNILFHLNQSYTHCLNLDDEPVIKDLPPDEKWANDLWSDLHRTPAPAPALANPAPARPPPAPVPAPQQTPAVAAATPKASSNAPQAICVKAKMRTVYTGKSWRCLK